MRSFIISLILFLCLITVISFNSIYVNRTAHEISRLVSLTSAEDDSSEAIETLLFYWEKHHPLLSLSVSFRELDKTQELLIMLEYNYKVGNAAEFEKTKQLLYDSADDLGRLERFSIENLL